MTRPTESDASAPEGDPWAAFGYLVAGVAFYGGIGWGLSVWLHASYLLPIGILVGAGLGMYMVIARFRLREPTEPTGLPASTEINTDHDEAARAIRPDSDDRGETA